MAAPPPSALAAALDRVGDRWSFLIVEALLDGARRFNELQQLLPGHRAQHPHRAAAPARARRDRAERCRTRPVRRGSTIASRSMGRSWPASCGCWRPGAQCRRTRPSRCVTRPAGRRSKRAGTAPRAHEWPTTRRRPSCASPERGALRSRTAPERTARPHQTSPDRPERTTPTGTIGTVPKRTGLGQSRLRRSAPLRADRVAGSRAGRIMRGPSHVASIARGHRVATSHSSRAHRRHVRLPLAVAAPAEAAQHRPSVKETSRFLWGLAGEESGWNYFVRNRYSGAFGKYQIMPFNWGPWTQQYIGQRLGRLDAGQPGSRGTRQGARPVLLAGRVAPRRLLVADRGHRQAQEALVTGRQALRAQRAVADAERPWPPPDQAWAAVDEALGAARGIAALRPRASSCTASRVSSTPSATCTRMSSLRSCGCATGRKHHSLWFKAATRRA